MVAAGLVSRIGAADANSPCVRACVFARVRMRADGFTVGGCASMCARARVRGVHARACSVAVELLIADSRFASNRGGALRMRGRAVRAAARPTQRRSEYLECVRVPPAL